MKSTLEEVLRYRNDDIVHRFIETWEMPFEEAEDIFLEMKRWLYLSAYVAERGGKDSDLAISQSLKLVDEMWHTFVLFTRDYQAFCDQYFGFYIHHSPTPLRIYNQQIAAYEQQPEQYMARLHGEFERQLSLVYDVLGEETVLKWYSQYLDKYTDEQMRRIWRWSFSPYDSRVREQVRLGAPGQPMQVVPQAKEAKTSQA